MNPRRIAHLDMDAFYASVELLRRPALAGLPVAIGGRGDPSLRGVVTTATYAARAFGIHSGMALKIAAALCPQCVFLPVDFDEYRKYSRWFKAAIAAVTPVIEDRGIDEVYIDLTDEAADSHTLALAIKAGVARATGLTCSIAVAPNKLLAKIGSELDKPDGLTILEMSDLESRIWPLPAKRINGVGPKADEKLACLNIRTIGDLARETPAFLVKHFGKNYGLWLHECAYGRDARPLVTHSEPKSRSRETTFQTDTRDWNEIAGVLAALCKQLSEDLQRRGYQARTIGIKLRYNNFQIVTRDNTLDQTTDGALTIRKAAFEALARVAPKRVLARPIRLIGVRAGSLAPAGAGAVTAASQRGISLPLF